MNFIADLLRAPQSVTTRKRTRNRTSTNTRKPNTQGRYRLYLENHPRSIVELAALLGYTYEGTRSTVRRYVARGVLKSAGKGQPDGVGRRPTLYVWVGEAL